MVMAPAAGTAEIIDHYSCGRSHTANVFMSWSIKVAPLFHAGLSRSRTQFVHDEESCLVAINVCCCLSRLQATQSAAATGDVFAVYFWWWYIPPLHVPFMYLRGFCILRTRQKRVSTPVRGGRLHGHRI